MLKVELKEFNNILATIESLYHDANVKLGISDSEFNILYTICYKGVGCNQSEVYRFSGLSRSTINSALRKMEKNGLLYLRQGEGRNTKLYLTEKGEEYLHDTVERIVAAENRIYLSWTEEERKAYVELNRKYANALKEELKDL
ncbi:MarR family transcriptional regulator [Ruminococcus sp.]|uniref:MarR family winged helix-turn-helix transcriptional regulator n=1 Tax=Ruminococcus sp. TaxID=41978 RepID=UPI0025D06CCF|nr:MarR family transcriptional regulator [Ruminococcus sp.]